MTVRLVSDAPSERDEFGSHERISDALVDIITTEMGQKTIGLEGPWGSGKSTVIKLLNNKIGSHKDICVVVFDAWAHEGDPLRRSFLESVINSLQDKQWVDKKTWDERKEELARRKKTITTNKTPLLTRFGLFILFLLLISPVAIAGFSGLIKFAFDNQAPYWAVPALVLTLLISLSLPSTFAYCVIRTVIEYVKCKFSEKKFECPFDWTMFLSKETSSVTKDVIENPDPTSIEFETTFFKLIEESIKDSRKLVIVIDNLDRISPEDSLKIWSTLRSFLEHREQVGKSYLSNLWVIIPYDNGGIKKVWESDKNQDTGKLATMFLDKLFQIRLFVPTPVLSDWRKYLNDLLSQAFCGHSRDELQLVSDFYGVYVAEMKKQSPTPRELKLFVNGIGGISRQWKAKEYPLIHIAYYYLLRSDNVDVHTVILKEAEISEKQLRILGEMVYDNLAGLLFNVEVNKARQIILKEPIQNALEAETDEDLKLLEKNNNIGFWYVINDSAFEVIESWIKQSPDNICMATKNLVSSELISHPNALILRELLLASTSKIERFSSFNAKISEGIQALIHLKADSEFVADLCGKIPRLAQNPKDPTYYAGWALGMKLLLEYLDKNDMMECIRGGIFATDDIESYAQICQQLESSLPEKHFKYVRISMSPKVLTKQLIESISNSDTPWKYVSTVNLIKELDGIDLGKVATAVDSRLYAMAISDEALSVINFIVDMKSWEVAQAKSLVENYITEGKILHYIHLAQVEEDYVSLGKLLFVLLNEERKVVLQGNYGDVNAGIGIVQRILQAPRNYSDIVDSFIEEIFVCEQYDLLAGLFRESDKADNLVIECFIKLYKDGRLEQVLTPEVFINYSDFLINNMNESDYRNIIGYMIEKGGLLQYITQGEFDAPSAEFYRHLVNNQYSSKQNEFIKWCLDKISEISLKDWVENFGKANSTMWLLIDLVEAGQPVKLGYTYIDALTTLGNSLLVDSSLNSDLTSNWDKLLKPLAPRQKGKIIEQLAENLLKQKIGVISEKYLQLFGGRLINNSTLRNSKELINNLLLPILRERDVASLEWMIQLIISNKDILSSEGDEVEEFRERLLALHSESILEGDAGKQIDQIASSIESEVENMDNALR